MPTAPGQSLQTSTLFVARGFVHHAVAPCPLLSVKCMFNGVAHYRADRRWFAADETGYLILNDRQAYEIHIDSPTQVESFIIFFPRQWAADVLHSIATPADRLLDEPTRGADEPVHFFEKFTAHDQTVSPALAALRQAHKSGALSDLWVEQRLRGLLARMLQAQRGSFRGVDGVPADRAATRQELWRRLNRARDFIRAKAHTPLTLPEIATEASLSPFHFLRSFKMVFNRTPHDFLSECRVERAKFLLERSELSVTEICFSVGFETPGAFSAWFRKLTGVSPRAWRARAQGQKSNFEEVFHRAIGHDERHEL